ncbi:MAG: glycosyltransferase family 9 protein, partial [Desulfatiglandaceae bacterium]
AGVPLCFLVTQLMKFFKLMRRPARKKAKNILLIELSEMGSAILADPAMEKLKKSMGAQLHFVIFEKNKPSLDFLKTVPEENIFCIRENGFFPLTIDTLRFLLWARKNRIDTVIDLELFSRFTALLTALCGAKNRVGFHTFHNEGLYRGDFLTHKVAYNPHLHIAKNFVALAYAIIDSNGEVPYSKRSIDDADVALKKARISSGAVGRVRDIVRRSFPDLDQNAKLILVNPNASDLLPQRRWPMENYTELIKKILSAHESAFILLTGSQDEQEESAALVESVDRNRCRSLAGKVRFLDLPALYSISDFMISNDSGPAHFAAVTDMPTYVFFGPETPRLYGSLGKTTPLYANLACSPCVSAYNHRKSPCRDNVCLKVITPEEVLEMIGKEFGDPVGHGQPH